MSQNKKTINISLVEKSAEWSGFVAMALAALLSILELHQARTQKPLAVLQPAYAATVSHVVINRGEELIRREKEETAHTVVSYGETMRSHAISAS